MSHAQLEQQVACVNQQCPQFGRVKIVKFQHLGNGLYLKGAVVCGCGFDVRNVSPDDARMGEPVRVALG